MHLLKRKVLLTKKEDALNQKEGVADQIEDALNQIEGAAEQKEDALDHGMSFSG